MTHAARQHVSIHSTLRAVRIVIAVVGLTSYLATDAVAQAAAVLEAFVRDATGATVPGAHIDVRGATTAQTFTDGAGRYRVAGLRPGRYTIRVELAGFAPATETADVDAGISTRNLTLNQLVASELVTVAGIGPGDRLDNPAESGSRLGLTVRETPAVINVMTLPPGEPLRRVGLPDADHRS